MNLKLISEYLGRTSQFFLEYSGLNYKTWEKLKRFFRTWGFNKKKQFEFIQDFSSWLNDGSSPKVACESIIRSGQNDSRLVHEVNAAKGILDALSRGLPISVGMADWFEPEVVSIFSAGQEAGAGALNKVVKEYLVQQEEIANATSVFWSPIKAPLIYLGMVYGFLLMMGLGILPQFADFLPAEKLDGTVVLVMDIAAWCLKYMYFILIIIFFAYLGFLNFCHNNVSKFRMAIDDYFPLNIYKNFAAMRTLKTFGILVETKYNVHKAAVELKQYSQGYMTYHLNHVIRETQFGESNVAEALNSGLLGKRLMFRLRNAASSSDQSKKKAAISIVADRSGQEAIRALKGTRIKVAIFVWLLVVAILLLTVASFMGILSSLLNLAS